VVTNLPMDARLLQEEIFGPILPVVAYDSLPEALEKIQSQPKPLALYLFSNDQNTKERVLKETSAGAVVINDCVLHFLHPHLPFGGVNQSGIGKSHGKSGFLAFSNEKPVLKQKTGTTSAQLLYPPYGRRSRFILNFIMRFGRWLS
jgi:aldehyde dehydrogenase (NAD+)